MLMVTSEWNLSVGVGNSGNVQLGKQEMSRGAPECCVYLFSEWLTCVKCRMWAVADVTSADPVEIG